MQKLPAMQKIILAKRRESPSMKGTSESLREGPDKILNLSASERTWTKKRHPPFGCLLYNVL